MDASVGLAICALPFLLPPIILGIWVGGLLGAKRVSSWATFPVALGIALVIPIVFVAFAMKVASDPAPLGGLGVPTPFFETPMSEARDSIVWDLVRGSFVLLILGLATAQLATYIAYRSALKKKQNRE